MRIAAIGDIHGCIEELTELLDRLAWLSLDQIWSLGDVCDRGPDTGACYALLRERGIPTILGNHDESILKHWDRVQKGGTTPQNRDKQLSLLQMTKEDAEFIRQMPKIHVEDKAKLVLVHGGVWPGVPMYSQPHNVIRAQLIHPASFTDVRWWGEDATLHKSKKTEAISRAEGFSRWYQLYDWEYDVAYGHSTWNQPHVHRNPGCGRTVGVDTGVPFGGSLTAGIFGDGEPWFVSVKAKKIWAAESSRVLWET